MLHMYNVYCRYSICRSLVQERRNSSALSIELRLFALTHRYVLPLNSTHKDPLAVDQVLFYRMHRWVYHRHRSR